MLPRFTSMNPFVKLFQQLRAFDPNKVVPFGPAPVSGEPRITYSFPTAKTISGIFFSDTSTRGRHPYTLILFTIGMYLVKPPPAR